MMELEQQKEASSSGVVIPSSPQISTEKKENTVRSTCCTKIGIFLGLSFLLAIIMGTVIYLGFWAHVYHQEDPGLLVVSGLIDGNPGNSTTVISLTKGRDACKNVPRFNHKIHGTVATVFNKRIKVCGGLDQNGRYLRECFSLDDSWVYFSSLHFTRAFSSATSVPDVGWWVTGGMTEDGDLHSSTEMLTIDGSPNFETGPRLPMALAMHCIVELKDSNFMLIGGKTRDEEATWLTWQMPWQTANRWISKANLRKARHSHSCLWDGRLVYVIGGIGFDGEPLDTIEAYEPALNKWRDKEPLPRPMYGGNPLKWQGLLSVLLESATFELDYETGEWMEKTPAIKVDSGNYGVAVITKLDWMCF